MHCHLLIPGLPPPSPWLKAGLLRDVRLPALETLLGRGNQSRLDGGMEAWLCRSFGVEKQLDWPVAAYTLLAEGGSPGSDFWLLAEPVHLQLQRDRMVLMDAGNLDISAQEAGSLTAALNSHFAADGLSFFPTRPGSWHLRLAHPARLETHPLEAVIGRNIRYFLPAGADGGNWHRILNEIQMLLHSHPVNQAREERGKPVINSIWPWGGGTLAGKLSAPYAQVWADNALARGLAIAAGKPHAITPASAGQWLQAAAPGQHLVILDQLGRAALYGDFPLWLENLLRLEADWFAPLRLALVRGKISQLSLHVFGDGQAQAFSISRSDLWKIWCRRKTLNNFK